MNFPDKILVGKDVPFIVYGHLKDGSTEDFTTSVKYTMDADNILTVTNGVMRANTAGTVKLTMEYQGVTLEKTIEAVSKVNTFDIVGGYFNPNLGVAKKNTLDFLSKELTVNEAWTVSGWTYDNGISISGNNYLVAKYKAGTGGNSDAIRLLLGNGNIYGPCYRSEVPVMVGDYYYLVVKLSDVTTTNTMGGDQNVAMDLTSIKTIGLQHFTGNTGFSIIVDEVYLSDTDPTASSNGSN